MRKHIFIVILVILLLLPIGVESGNAMKMQSLTSGNLSYNFSNLSVGSYPVNRSWISFSAIHNGSYFQDQVVSTSYGNGLDILTTDQAQSSYLEANISSYSTYTLYMNFTWNSNGYYGVTQDNINFYGGSSNLFDLSFGPVKSFDTHLINSSESKILGIEPAPNQMITLSATFNQSTPGFSFVTLKQAGKNVTAFPVKVGFKGSAGSALSLRIGGMYSNLTIFNIECVKGAAGNAPHLEKSGIQFNNTSFRAGNGFIPDTASTVSPYMDTGINSIIYYSEGVRIVSFDYYNSSFVNISSEITNLSGGIYSNGSLYYWQSGGSINLVKIGTENLSMKDFHTGIALSGKVGAVISGKRVLFYNTTGSIVEYNISSGSIYKTATLGPGTSVYGFRLLGMNLKDNTLSVTGFSNESRIFLQDKLNFSTLSAISERRTNYSFLTGSLSLVSYGYSLTGLAGMFTVADNLSQSYLETNYGNIYTSPGNRSLSSVLYSTGTYYLILWKNRMYRLSPGGILQGTNIEQQDSGYLVSSNANNSVILSLHGNEITVYYSGSSLPLSNSKIKITGNRTYLARGESYVNLSVESSLQYKISLQVSGLSLTLKNRSSFHFNSTLLPEGADTAYVNATNQAGFSSNETITLEVDNAIPVVSVSIRNGTYISNSTRESFSVNDTIGVKAVHITYLSSNLSFDTGNGSFYIETGNVTGKINIKMNVTDRFGMEFRAHFIYYVVGYNTTSSLSIWNGEFLNSSSVNVSWAPEKNATTYDVMVSSNNSSRNFTTSHDYMILNLGNGDHSVTLFARLLDDKTVKLADANVTVIAFSPSLNITGEPSGEYSFMGNSNENHFITEITSNISAEMQLSLYGPHNMTVYNTSGEDRIVFDSSYFISDLSLNGRYVVKVRATTMSGTWAQSVFTFMVNNTIPGAPETNGTSFYTNSSHAHISLVEKAGMGYSILLTSGAKSELISPENLTSFTLLFGQGIYTLNITAYSKSGNHNFSEVTISYYNATPAISYTIAKNAVGRNYTFLNYSISDEAKVTRIILDVNGINESLNTSNGSELIRFPHNGNYSISLFVSDECGNRNSTGNITVNVSYYIHLASPEIKAYESGSTWHFLITGQGNGISRVHVEWYVDGKKVSTGLSFNQSLTYGVHTISATLTYQGKTIHLSRKIIFVGLIPYIAGPAVAASIVGYRMFGTNRNVEEIRRVVMDNTGRPVREALRQGRRNRIPASRMKSQISKMQREGLLKVEKDPDGHDYIMGQGK